jgi:hypothetical protein
MKNFCKKIKRKLKDFFGMETYIQFDLENGEQVRGLLEDGKCYMLKEDIQKLLGSSKTQKVEKEDIKGNENGIEIVEV